MQYRSNCRGTASVEAAIALPVLIIILFGVLYVSRSITGRHQAEALARSCAWRYTASGCVKKAIPPECIGLLRTARPDFELEGAVDAAGAEVDIDFVSAFEDSKGYLKSKIVDIVTPIIGSAVIAAIQKEGRATVGYAVAREGLKGDAMHQLSVKYQLPCNLVSTTPAQVAEDAWNAGVKSLF